MAQGDIQIDEAALKKALENAGFGNVTPTSVRAIVTVTRGDGTVEEHGTVAYWHRNPVKRILWKIKNKLKG